VSAIQEYDEEKTFVAASLSELDKIEAFYARLSPYTRSRVPQIS
jgi:hypothetical protein